METVEDIEGEIEKLRERQKSLQAKSDEALIDSLKHHEYLFTVVITNSKSNSIEHYGCFDSFKRAQEAVEKIGTYRSGSSNPVYYSSNVGVRSFQEFSIYTLRRINEIPSVWKDYWSD